MSMQAILEYLSSKEEEYKPFDPCRFVKLFEILQPKIQNHFCKEPPFLIHIVGTNGKGSTGRFLSLMLLATHKTVGHFTSPHLLNFKERFWENGAVVHDERLSQVHELLLSFKDEAGQSYVHEASYFEYATLLAYVLFYPLEYGVIEAGLGGEYDSTTALGCQLSAITPIAFDHQELLGHEIQVIAKTKLKSIKHTGIIGYQPFYDEILPIIEEIRQMGVFLEVMKPHEFSLNAAEQAYLADSHLPSYQAQNFMLAKKVMERLGFCVDVVQLKPFDLSGRCQRIAKNIFVDVGHNVHAAQTMLNIFNGQKIDLIYNSYKDKDYGRILEILKPIINKIHVLKVSHSRMVDFLELTRSIRALGMEYDEECMSFDEHKNYLVFGSFALVQTFILQYQEIYEI